MTRPLAHCQSMDVKDNMFDTSARTTPGSRADVHEPHKHIRVDVRIDPTREGLPKALFREEHELEATELANN